MLAERRDSWEQRHELARLYDQHATLPALKAERHTLAEVQSQVLQNVAVRIDLAFQAFFRRARAGEQEPGYPRFRGWGRYDRLTFPQVPVGCKLDGEAERLRVMNVGQVKIVIHRPLEGTPKTATLRRSSTGKWYVSFACECADTPPLPATGCEVGLDVGLKTFAMPCTGTQDAIENPRFFRRDEHALAGAQRRLSREEKGTPERGQRGRIVARAHERIAWRRDDFAHQHRRRIINIFDLIAVEDLSVNRMTHNRCLAKSIHDAAWGQFADLLSYKAAWAGRRFVAVNPAYTSQDCPSCGHRQTLALSDRIYTCPCCGLVLDRDLNAARNILRLAKASLRDLLGLGQQSLAQA